MAGRVPRRPYVRYAFMVRGLRPLRLSIATRDETISPTAAGQNMDIKMVPYELPSYTGRIFCETAQAGRLRLAAEAASLIRPRTHGEQMPYKRVTRRRAILPAP